MSAAQRHFGSWPPSCWGTLNDAQKKVFFHVSSNKVQEIVRTLNAMSRQRDEKRNEHILGDAFHPLSVWEKIGYNTEAIEQNTPEHLKEWNPILDCMTYAVSVHTKRRSDINAVTNDNAISGAFGRQKARLTANGGIKLRHAKETLSSDKSDDSESSSEYDGTDPKKIAAKSKRKAARETARAKKKAARAKKRAKDHSKAVERKSKKEEKKARSRQKRAEAAAKEQKKAEETTQRNQEKIDTTEKKLAEKCRPKVMDMMVEIVKLKEGQSWSVVHEAFGDKLDKRLVGLKALKETLDCVITDPAPHKLPDGMKDYKAFSNKSKPWQNLVSLATNMAKMLDKQISAASA